MDGLGAIVGARSVDSSQNEGLQALRYEDLPERRRKSCIEGRSSGLMESMAFLPLLAVCSVCSALLCAPPRPPFYGIGVGDLSAQVRSWPRHRTLPQGAGYACSCEDSLVIQVPLS